MAEIKEIKKLFETYKQGIKKLKEIEGKLDEMDVSGYEEREKELRQTLKKPRKVDEVEERFEELKRLNEASELNSEGDRLLKGTGQKFQEKGWKLLNQAKAGGKVDFQELESRLKEAITEYETARAEYKKAKKKLENLDHGDEAEIDIKLRKATKAKTRCKIWLGEAKQVQGKRSFKEEQFKQASDELDQALKIFDEIIDSGEDIGDELFEDLQDKKEVTESLIDKTDKGKHLRKSFNSIAEEIDNLEVELDDLNGEDQEYNEDIAKELREKQDHLENHKGRITKAKSFTENNGFTEWDQEIKNYEDRLKELQERISNFLSGSSDYTESTDDVDTNYEERLFVTWQQSKEEFGRYEQRGIIGEGGGGIVYLAYDPKLKTFVALKLLPINLRKSPKAEDTLIKEARMAAQLDSHPNIVSIKDITLGNEGVPSSIIMEYVDGPDLKYLIEEKGPLPLMKVKRYLKQMCKALHFAHHEKGIIHSDIKPSNILVGYDDRIVITDFGLARTLSDTISRKQGDNSTMDGYTPTYSPPEQHMGEALSPASDVYALGVTLYEMITGEPPFTRGNLTYQHRKKEPDPPSVTKTDLSEEVDKVIMKCLQKEPENRYSDTMEVWEDFSKLESVGGPGE